MGGKLIRKRHPSGLGVCLPKCEQRVYSREKMNGERGEMLEGRTWGGEE